MFLANNGGGKSGGSGGGSSGGSSGGGGIFGGMFGGEKSKAKDPLELAKQWKRDLQKEIRRMERDINDIKRLEQKSLAECRALAKKGRISAVKILAKEVASTRKTVERMYTAKAQLSSVSSTLQTSMCKYFGMILVLCAHEIYFLFLRSAAMMKMQGCMTKSAEIMTAMNQ